MSIERNIKTAARFLGMGLLLATAFVLISYSASAQTCGGSTGCGLTVLSCGSNTSVSCNCFGNTVGQCTTNNQTCTHGLSQWPCGTPSCSCVPINPPPQQGSSHKTCDAGSKTCRLVSGSGADTCSN